MLAIWELLRPRERGALYSETRLESWHRMREFNRRSRQMMKEPWTEPLAIEITGEDVKAIEAMVTACDDSWNRRRSDAPMHHDGLIKQLYVRVGAATANTSQPETIPLYESEIQTLELLLPLLGQYGARSDIEAARHILNKLHALQGRARAMRTIGGIPVTDPAIER
ncbi:hypothetical protein [Streptomyces sp. CT34]|uniref:hypothetical protein n=1 Tax=Streptomyces sp. CT34 TaxID=1553907 RepID=UPI0005BB21D5|nr:hypothetical protein [Streptomyces sp. CT34]